MALEAKVARQHFSADAPVPASDCQPLRECLCSRLERYFADLDGDPPAGDLHGLVMAEVEAPLLEITLQHTKGNLSRAADVLGMNRATLRRKLRRYGLLGN